MGDIVNKSAAKPGELGLSVNFHVPRGMRSAYAQQMLAQVGPNEVVLSFFEVTLPIIREKLTDEQLSALEEAGLDAECVAKVAIPRAIFHTFVDAMQQALKLASIDTENLGHANAKTGDTES